MTDSQTGERSHRCNAYPSICQFNHTHHRLQNAKSILPLAKVKTVKLWQNKATSWDVYCHLGFLTARHNYVAGVFKLENGYFIHP